MYNAKYTQTCLNSMFCDNILLSVSINSFYHQNNLISVKSVNKFIQISLYFIL